MRPHQSARRAPLTQSYPRPIARIALRALLGASTAILALACSLTEDEQSLSTEDERPLSAEDQAACADYLKAAEDGMAARFGEEFPSHLSDEMSDIAATAAARFTDRTCGRTLRAGYDYCSEIAEHFTRILGVDTPRSDIEELITECYEQIRRTETTLPTHIYRDGYLAGINCAFTPLSDADEVCLAALRAARGSNNDGVSE